MHYSEHVREAINYINENLAASQCKVINNISKKLAVMLIDEVDTMGIPGIIDMKDSQKKVLEVLNTLVHDGEIVL